MNGLVIIAIIVVATLIVFIVRALPGNRAERLRQQYFRAVHLPRPQAEEALQRHIARLQQRFPQRSEAWYLRYVLEELRRDRR